MHTVATLFLKRRRDARVSTRSRWRPSLRQAMIGFIAVWVLCGGISSLLGVNAVLSTALSGVALIASMGGTILFRRWWERDLRRHAVDAAGLRGLSGVWP